MSRRLSPEQISVITDENFSPELYFRLFPHDNRSDEALYRARRRYSSTGSSTPYVRAEDPVVSWDKKEADVHWTEWIDWLEQGQSLHKRASGSQDTATIQYSGNGALPLLFISDWHIGSWGTSYRKLVEVTNKIRKLGLRVAVLGDMLQMSIRLRGILEISDNALTPRDQMSFLRSWLEEMADLILWATWDNHSVEREEDATGFSYYAELFKERTIYHSGIGHIDLEVGNQTYKIASSHRFKGNTQQNPVNGAIKYMRFFGIDRELAVAGDSHAPALFEYADGPLPRLAINCGSLQGDSGYGKRHFSLFSHDWMPVALFCRDTHLIIPFKSLESYEWRNA
jgi:hypothetical protein